MNKTIKAMYQSVSVELANTIASAKKAGARMFEKLVNNVYTESEYFAEGKDFIDLEDAEQIRILKDVRATLKPFLCKAAGITEDTAKVYMSGWVDQLGYAKQKQPARAKKPANASSDDTESDTEMSGEGSADAVSISFVSKDSKGWILTGKPEKDVEALEELIEILIHSKEYGSHIKGLIHALAIAYDTEFAADTDEL